MRRKLINFDVFERIEQDSLSTAQEELTKAAPVLAKALNESDLRLRCYGPENVIYETLEGTFVHANYQVKEGFIEFDNLEELVINEETEQKEQRRMIGEMLDALLENGTTERADTLFNEFLAIPRTRRIFSETKRTVPVRKDGDTVGYEVKDWSDKPSKKQSKSDVSARMKGKKKKSNKPKKADLISKRKRLQSTLADWAVMTDNIFDYLGYKEHGPVLRESEARHDEKGNVVALRIPSTKMRNEMKMLEFDWKTLQTDLLGGRNKAKSQVCEDMEFCKSVANLKRHNAMSDNTSLEEALESIVTTWPGVLYLTQGELAENIKQALQSTNATNWDDQTCEFMSEGILRTAHKAYVDRVSRVMRLAGVEPCTDCEDPYAQFKETVDQYYPGLDEVATLDMQVFVDLYEAIRSVHDYASEDENHLLRAEAAGHLDDLLPIIQQEVDGKSQIAESAADFLWNIVESNLEGMDWSVSNTPHITVSGNHPAMAEKAKTKYAPSADFDASPGDQYAPQLDDQGGSYKPGGADQVRNSSWGNEGGSDAFPSLRNPYVPAPFGDYKIKGEKHVDADSGQLAHWGDGNTWPALQNPYVPQAETPQTDKMNQGRQQDLVVDK